MTWLELLHKIEALEEALEGMPQFTSNTAHFVRMELANHIARSRELLEALAADERGEEKP